MCIPNTYGNNYAQDGCGMNVVIDSTLPLSSVVTDFSFIDLFLRLPQDSCSGCGYSSSFEKISESCVDAYLQEYAAKCGYQLTENFLSVMNKCKIDFIGKVDSILVNLSSSFCFFLKGLKGNDKRLSYLMDKTCSYFSKSVYDLRPKCIKVLQCNTTPIVVKIIFDSRVVDSGSERKMTYPEMEQLFIHFVTSLEKLVMLKIMNCWRDFYNENNVQSLMSDVDYSNPFIRAYNFYGISIPDISCPAAFADKFGECISFIAIAKIDEMTGSFVDKCNDVLKKIIYHKCYCIFDHAVNIYNYLKELRDKLTFLVKEEFDKKIIEEGVDARFRNFLNSIVVWNKSNRLEVNTVLVFGSIIKDMNNFLVSTVNSELHNIIRFFQEGNRLGVYLHCEDNCKISSIRGKFYLKYRRIIKNKFCAMLRDRYKFSDGTVIETLCWDKVSKNLLPIVQEIIKPIVDDERENISKVLSSARVVEDIGVFDVYSAGTRNATSGEIAGVLKNFTDLTHSKNRNLCIKIWTKLVDAETGNVSKDHIVSNELPHPINIGDDSLVLNYSVKSNLLVDVPRSVYNLISAVRKKFSIEIRNHLEEFFSGVRRSKNILPSGRDIRDYSRGVIYSELSEIAIESLKFINEKQCDELDIALSNALMVEVKDSTSLSYVIRRVTADEKNDLMACARKVIDESLIISVKKSFSSVFNKSFIKYGYKEKYKDVDVEDVAGMWGVKLRYSDNVSILKVRKKFSSIIKGIVYNKFSGMVKNYDKFDGGDYIGSFAWFRVSKKLLPIAKAEVRIELEKEREELEEVISKSRVVVDSKVDRELTNEEKSKALEKIMVLVYDALRVLFRRIWNNVIKDNVITTLKCDSVSETNCVDKFSPSSVNGSGIMEPDGFGKGDPSKVKLYYEDDAVILRIRKKFSCEIYSCVSNKFNEMIDKKYKFDDDTVICLYSWKKMSNKLFPIIEKEIDPIVENERVKISEALLGSRVVVSLPDISGATVVTRKLTSEERSYVLKNIMESIYKLVAYNSGRIWNRIVKLTSSGLVNISEVDKSEIDNIRLEFIGSLGLIVNEVVDSLLPNDDSLVSSEYMIFNVCNIVYERSRNFFKEGGFLSRVELLLSSAKIVSSSRGDRLITDEEKECVLRELMDKIDSDRDNLVKKRTGEKLKSFLFSSRKFSI